MIKQVWMVITPEIAKEWLPKNVKNRKVKPRDLKRYARDMRHGRWQKNGETIKIAQDGTILDGQHRLMACILANTPFESLVVTGLPHEQEVKMTIDAGVPRSFSDNLHIRERPNSNNLAAASRALWIYAATRNFRRPPMNPSHQELNEVLERFPQLEEAIIPSNALNRAIGAPAPVFAALWTLFGEVDKEDRDFFFERLKEGQGLETNSPLLVLRNQVAELSRKSAKKGTKMLLDNETVGAWAIKSWNLFCKHQVITKLIYLGRDKYPVIEGLNYSVLSFIEGEEEGEESEQQ